MTRRVLGFAITVLVVLFGPSLTASMVPADALVSKVQWNNFGAFSPTLTIYPTVLGRVLAAPAGLDSLIGLHMVDQNTSNKFWQASLELASKLPGKARSISMHQQFNCHFYFASKNPLQNSWNIDVHRQPAGMNIQVINGCNNPLLDNGQMAPGW